MHATIVNDIHAKLNETRVAQVIEAHTIEDVIQAVQQANLANQIISIAGSRHAMGGQQFGEGTILLDMRKLNRIIQFDLETGEIDVEAGIEWPELIAGYEELQSDSTKRWGIAQKQTGADRLTIGGAIAANVHGRGLTMKPFIQDIVSLKIVNTEGQLIQCSRAENTELFQLVHGGYGLFGIVVSAKIQLVPKQKVARIVEMLTLDNVIDAVNDRIANGYLYGDFQFGTNEQSDNFLHSGIFSCYRPADASALISEAQAELSEEDWGKLLYLGHVDKAAAFQYYTDHYLATSGQVYWSDTQQLSTYLNDYHTQVDQQMGVSISASEIITEIYVPRTMLGDFMATARTDFIKHSVDIIYGTVRFIEQDDESFLAWARHPFACIIFNLHTAHDEASLQKTAVDFRRLIDRAISFKGSYYLTYHKYATREQVLACYPNFVEFLQLKRKYDPNERFQSEWYRHYQTMFATELQT